MEVKQFVEDVLCVPMTRVGFKYIVQAIEIVLDTHEHKFYSKLADITQTQTNTLETAMRAAKNLGLDYMYDDVKQQIFGLRLNPTVGEYVVKSAEYYRRHYAE